MAKRLKLSVLSENDEALLAKGSRKERAKAVTGKPDQSDIDNLKAVFDLYEKSRPGLIRKMKQDYDFQKSLNDTHKPSFKGIDSKNLSFAFWMPKDLQEFVEQYWPTLWTNRSHMEWFIKKFPVFKA